MFSFLNVTGQQANDFEKFRVDEMKAFSGLRQNNIASSIKKKYNVIYARCKWTVDPTTDNIAGTITYYFISGENNFDTLTFDLSDQMNVSSAIYHLLPITFQHSGNLLDIVLPSPLTAGTIDSVDIVYQGTPAATGNGSFVNTDHSGTPVLWTLSEPYGARDWWPCKQDLNDKIDSIDIYVTSPIQYKTASNGLLISEDSTTSQRTCHWKSNYPVAAYLVAIGVTNYSVFSELMVLSNGDTLPIINYVYPENLALAQQVLPEIVSIIHLYDSLTIPYPFSKEKYGHAQFGWGGGMEHQTMTFIGNYNSELIAHECAHQWFGDQVTCSSWKDIWLHEGFATYFSGLVVEHFHPDDWKAWKTFNLDNAVSLPGGSVFCDDTTNVSRIFDGRLSYRKASCLLHMIRWKLGDAAFFTGLKNYLNDTSLSYRYAATDDLRHHFELTGNQNLSQFFDEWYYGSGFPSYRVEWERVDNTIDLTIFQTTSDTSVNFFHVPVPIELKGENGDTIVIADPTYSGENFLYNPGFKVEQVVFDPDLWIISKDNRVVEISNGLNDKVEVFPNPGRDIFTLYSKSPELFATSLDVFDHTGKKIISISYPDSNSKHKIDMSTFSAGNYIFRIATGSGMVMKKVVLQK